MARRSSRFACEENLMFSPLSHLVSSSRRPGPLVVALFVLATVCPSAVSAGDGDAVAIVNGQPISRETLIDTLIDAHGVEVLQQLIILQVAKQETKQRGLRVTPADVDAEFELALSRVAQDAGMTGEYATPKNKRDALQEVLKERGFSMAEFMVGMERNAHLRKIVEKDLRITEETLREEFARTYGEKVRARHIQIAQRDTHGLNEAMELLHRGADFADVARRLSKNPETAARGGEMDPFTFNDPDIPAALREAAFSLKEGSTSSPVLVGQFFHILKVESRIPPDNARFEDKRAEIEQSVRERAIPQAMAKLAVELFKEAEIRVLDSKLRSKYQEFLDEGALRTVTP
jgi:foldase protein PrsA